MSLGSFLPHYLFIEINRRRKRYHILNEENGYITLAIMTDTLKLWPYII